jgi:hypothetical protein
LLLLTLGVGVVPGAVIIVGLPTWNAIEGVFGTERNFKG